MHTYDNYSTLALSALRLFYTHTESAVITLNMPQQTTLLTRALNNSTGLIIFPQQRVITLGNLFLFYLTYL